YNDELAMLLLEVLREQNIKVPEDISLIGYDDSVLSRVSEVKLTTIKHPQSEMGETAAKMMLDLLDGKSSSQSENQEMESIVYEPQLVIRNSVKDFKEYV